MISLSGLMSILHFSINVPMRWLAGETHFLSAHEWYVKSMGRSTDFLYDAILKLDKYGWKILDEQLMFNIFKPLKRKSLDEYVKYIFDFKKTPTVSNKGKTILERKSKRNCSPQPAKIINQRRCL